MQLNLNIAPMMSPDEIRTGDLLAWKEDSVSGFSNLCVKTVRALTSAKYGHVGIAWRCHDGLNDELFVIEATIPKVHAARLIPNRDFDCVPMGIEWTVPGKNFLMGSLGKDYSLLDALRALFGIKLKNDDDYQCVELAHWFYEKYNIILEHDFTPGGIVAAASKYTGVPVQRVVPLYKSLLEEISS